MGRQLVLASPSSFSWLLVFQLVVGVSARRARSLSACCPAPPIRITRGGQSAPFGGGRFFFWGGDLQPKMVGSLIDRQKQGGSHKMVGSPKMVGSSFWFPF